MSTCIYTLPPVSGKMYLHVSTCLYLSLPMFPIPVSTCPDLSSFVFTICLYLYLHASICLHPSEVRCIYTSLPVSGKMYSCQYCSATFAQSIELTRHVRTHTGDKPYVCRECGKGFKQANGLSVHLQTFHSKHTHTHSVSIIHHCTAMIIDSCRKPVSP